MKIIGIDASTHATGVSIFEDNKLIHSEVITANDSDVLARIKKQRNGIHNVIEEYRPDEVWIEEVLPDYARYNQATNKALMYLQAEIAMEFYDYNMKLNFFVASEWRKLCGIHTGRVKREELKQSAINLVKKQFNKEVTDDEADAICIGYAAIKRNKRDAADFFEFK